MKNIILGIVFLIVAVFLSGCATYGDRDNMVNSGDTEIENAVSSETSTGEKELPGSEVQEFIASFESWDDLYIYIKEHIKEKLISEGEITEGDSLYFTYRDVADHFFERTDENDNMTFSGSFFYFGKEGNVIPIGYSATLEIKDDRFSVVSLDYLTVGKVIEGVGDEKTEWDYYDIFEDLSFYFLHESFDELIGYQTKEDAANLEKLMAENNLTPDMIFAKLLFEQNKDAYKDPIQAMETMLPALKGYPKRLFVDDEFYDIDIFIDFGKDKEAVVNMEVLGKTDEGDLLYAIGSSGFASKDEEERKAKFCNVTQAELDAAAEVSFTDVYSGTAKTDYFYVGRFEGTDIELYGATNFSGYVVKIGSDICPLIHRIGRSGPENMFSGDFDGDGEIECGFTQSEGWGTGYYVDGLVMIDPNEEKKFSFFDIKDLTEYNGNVFSKVKTGIDEQSSVLVYWIEDDGKVRDKGRIKLEDTITDGSICRGLGFGDQFFIDYVDDEWKFTAIGGSLWSDRVIPDYEDSVNLTGTIEYKNGSITFNNLHLAAGEMMY
ncbi:MAG: hypothetical protein IJ195_03465 [Lachnospiraceae bacterium]|nr:hypothetical protein [Lachnospiraceae bacterium]MBR1650138.1 hypothetical protein [Lachnospiraceae bacterium]